MSGTLSVYGQGDGKLIEEFNMRRENKELRAEVARLTEDLARAEAERDTTRKQRDRSYTGYMILIEDGVISMSRAAELLGMSASKWRDVANKINNKLARR